MKEYSISLQNSFAKGLRLERSTARNVEALTHSMNAVPCLRGLERFNLLNSVFPTMAISFPFPQVFFFKNFTLVGTADGVYEMKVDGTFLLRVSAGVAAAWDILDFGPYILCVNNGRVWERDIDTGLYAENSYTNFPQCSTIDNYNGQLITGGDLSIPSNKNRVRWGNIGTTDFTIGRSNLAGFYDIFDSGPIMAIKKLGESFIVYAANSVTLFFPASSPVNTFGNRRLLDIGVSSKGSVGVSGNKHVVVMSNGEVYEISSEGAKYVGYKEFFDSFSDIRITYNPADREFYISNSLHTYVYTDSGLGEIGQTITSGGMFEGDFYVMADSPTDESFVVTTDSFDMLTRGQKTISSIELSIDSATGIEVAIDWRIDIREGFRRTKWITVGPSGIGNLPVTGIEFRLAVRAQLPGEVNLSAALIRWKLTDKRSIRGPYGGK